MAAIGSTGAHILMDIRTHMFTLIHMALTGKSTIRMATAIIRTATIHTGNIDTTAGFVGFICGTKISEAKHKTTGSGGLRARRLRSCVPNEPLLSSAILARLYIHCLTIANDLDFREPALSS